MTEFIKNNWEAIIAILALMTSSISVIVSYFTFRHQRTHDVKMIKPILQIGQWDYENRLKIDLRNNGLGPAMINKISVYDKKGNSKTCIYHWLPDKLPGSMNYKEYWTAFENFVIQTDYICVLIEIPIDDEKSKQVKYREKIRNIISMLTIKVEYSDIYGNKMANLEKNFWIFKRTDNVN